MSTELQPGVADAALDAFERALGAGAVVRADADLDEYTDQMAYPGWRHRRPAAAVLPASVEEVQAVLRIANEHRVPLWPHSTGRNNGYGGAGPRTAGTVVVSLRRMNRVLEVDGDLGYALVEPGVRWFDLHEAIVAAGHDLMVSVADLGWGGPIGNSLENGITYLPQAVDFGAMCGMEVVLPDGSVMRTGMGAMPGNRAWNLYKRGLGPSVDGLFQQSNLGIVTKLGVWLMPRPECYAPMHLRVWRDDDIGAVIDTLRRLLLDDTVRMVPTILNALNQAAVRTTRADVYAGDGPIPEPEIDRIARELGTGRWMMRFALYGDAPVVEHRIEKVRAAFGAIEGSDLHVARYGRDDYGSIEVPGEKILAGIPNMEWGHISRWAGGDSGGHIGFSPVVPMRGEEVLRVRNLLRGLMEESGLDYLAGLIPPHARSFIHIAMIMFDTDDEAQTARAYEAATRLVTEAAKHGYGEYRAHVHFMEEAAAQYSFGDHAYRKFVQRIKAAVDPNNVLAPGKNGIHSSQPDPHM